MTQSIDNNQRIRAQEPPEQPEPDFNTPNWVVRIVAVVGAVSAFAGVGFLAVAFTHTDWRLATAGIVLSIVATVAGGIFACHLLLADRRSFYSRGKLEGWMQGWRGLPPEPDDPLRRR